MYRDIQIPGVKKEKRTFDDTDVDYLVFKSKLIVSKGYYTICPGVYYQVQGLVFASGGFCNKFYNNNVKGMPICDHYIELQLVMLSTTGFFCE